MKKRDKLWILSAGLTGSLFLNLYLVWKPFPIFVIPIAIVLSYPISVWLVNKKYIKIKENECHHP